METTWKEKTLSRSKLSVEMWITFLLLMAVTKCMNEFPTEIIRCEGAKGRGRNAGRWNISISRLDVTTEEVKPVIPAMLMGGLAFSSPLAD